MARLMDFHRQQRRRGVTGVGGPARPVATAPWKVVPAGCGTHVRDGDPNILLKHVQGGGRGAGTPRAALAPPRQVLQGRLLILLLPSASVEWSGNIRVVCAEF
jgi:hypothetical protein